MKYNFKDNYDKDVEFQLEYDNLIEFRKINILPKFKNHNHHIKPKCFFKKDEIELQESEDNKVYLNPSEHFMAHYFLFEIYNNSNRQKQAESMFKSMKITLPNIDDINKDMVLCSEIYGKSVKEYYIILENNGKEQVKELCDFINDNNRYPKKSNEPKLYNKLTGLKQAKKDKGHTIFFDSYKDIADSYGFYGLFDIKTEEEKGKEQVTEICEFIKETGRKLIKGDSLHNKLFMFKYNKSNDKSKGLFFDSYQEIANSYGFNDLFITKTSEERILSNITDICDFIDENGKLPSSHGISNEEKNISNYLYQIRKTNLDEDCIELLKSRGYYNDIYNPKTKEEIDLENIGFICDFVDKNGYTPTSKSEDKSERILSGYLSSFRKDDKLKSYYDLIKERKYPDLFEKSSYKRNFYQSKDKRFDFELLEKNGLVIINEICDFVESKNIIPSSKSKDILEKRLGDKLVYFKQNKKKNENGKKNGDGRGYWFTSFDELVNDRGYPDLFVIITPEMKGLDKINVICDFIDENGRIPNHKKDKELYKTLSNLKRNQKYKSYQDLLIKRGYPDIIN